MNIPRLAGDREISGKWMVAITRCFKGVYWKIWNDRGAEYQNNF